MAKYTLFFLLSAFGLGTQAEEGQTFEKPLSANTFLRDLGKKEMKGENVTLGGGDQNSESIYPFKKLSPSDLDCIHKQIAEYNEAQKKTGPLKGAAIKILVDARYHGTPDDKYYPSTGSKKDYRRDSRYYADAQFLGDGQFMISVGINKWGDCNLVSRDQIAETFKKGPPAPGPYKVPVDDGSKPGTQKTD